MSFKLVRKSFNKDYICPHEKKPVTGVQKSILEYLALIGKDSEDGKFIINIFASQPTVADETLFGLSTVQRAFKVWVKRKVLVAVGKKFGNVVEYKIDIIMLNFFLTNAIETEKMEKTTQSERPGGKSERPGIESQRPTNKRLINDYYNNKNNNNSESRPTSLDVILNYKSPEIFILSEEQRKKSIEAMRQQKNSKNKESVTH